MRKKVAIDYNARCRKIRRLKGWTRGDLGEAIGYSARTVENWELSRARPDRRARKLIKRIWVELRERERRREDAEGRASA